jgi:uncharacterized protein YlzI (FlbEa/FlbD family)
MEANYDTLETSPARFGLSLLRQRLLQPLVLLLLLNQRVPHPLLLPDNLLPRLVQPLRLLTDHPHPKLRRYIALSLAFTLLKARGVRRMERDPVLLMSWNGSWRVRREEVEEVLERVVEYDFVVLPAVHRPSFECNVEWGDFGLAGEGPRVEFEVVKEGHGLFAGFGDEGYADDDFEFAPSSLCNFKGWFVDVYAFHPSG